jgi:hypothetical protein
MRALTKEVGKLQEISSERLEPLSLVDPKIFLITCSKTHSTRIFFKDKIKSRKEVISLYHHLY